MKLKNKLVFEGEVAVDPLFESLDVERAQVGLEWMSRTCGRQGAQGGDPVEALPHTLGRPEQEGNLLEAQGCVQVSPAAFPIPDGMDEPDILDAFG